MALEEYLVSIATAEKGIEGKYQTRSRKASRGVARATIVQTNRLLKRVQCRNVRVYGHSDWASTQVFGSCAHGAWKPPPPHPPSSTAPARSMRDLCKLVV